MKHLLQGSQAYYPFLIQHTYARTKYYDVLDLTCMYAIVIIGTSSGYNFPTQFELNSTQPKENDAFYSIA